MNEKRVRKDELLNSLPAEWPASLLLEIQARLAERPVKVVVLDDDPTGTQTVHGIPVLTEWPVSALQAELQNDLPAFYLLTNSRSFPLAEAQALNTVIGQRLVAAAQAAGRDFVVVSRSDSTLRGHFPGEVEALARALGQDFDAWLIIPFFLEGGRYTIHDVHYVAEGDWLVPAGQTQFARDAAFGYRASNLREWVAEKTGGRVSPDEVASISIEDLRLGGPRRVADRLIDLPHGGICVINAASIRDLEVFVSGLLDAEAAGRRFLYRTAASFVQVRAGIAPRPLLTPDELALPEAGGGLLVVGSYVPKSTQQLAHLLQDPHIVQVEVDVRALLSDQQQAGEIRKAVTQTDQALQQGQDVVVFTSRELVVGEDVADSLAIGRRISESLVTIVRQITQTPRYLLAKGGITSSDVATRGLGIRRALVLGQILPGVPVWQLGPESRYPGRPYIVFPGNVGGPEALTSIVQTLRAR